MVALMLLVLLTIAAVGMSRNSFQEIVNSGFARQAAMADSMANSGVEWSIYWMDENNQPGNGVDPMAQNLEQLKHTLATNPNLRGAPYSVADSSAGTPYTGTGAANIFLPGPNGTTNGYTIGLTSMGKWPVVNFSQGNGQGAFAPGSGSQQSLGPEPDLWAVRSDSQIVQGNVSFTHGVEAWFTTPVQ
jgi:hypothetical protein